MHYYIIHKETYVGVCSRSELLDSSVWSNVFNDESKGSFVELRITTTTTTRLLLASFRLH